MGTATIAPYWNEFQAGLPAGSPYRGAAWNAETFGDSAELADELANLVLDGTKCATCSALWAWQADREPVAEPGRLTILLDGRNDPVCIVETTEVAIRPFDEVDARFARDEGEGDRSLAHWRAVHEAFFRRSLPTIGKAFTPDMPLVCERFRVIHRRHG